MKKAFSLVMAALLAVFALVGCSNDSAQQQNGADAEQITIKVGASPSPHAEILEQVVDKLAEQGYTLQIIEYTDYVQPNLALESGDLAANYFQHKPYLEDFNEKNGTHLVPVANIHYEPYGLYAGKTASIDELKDGATIAVPNDASNEARALLLLEATGLIKLKPDAGLLATVMDITENPKNLKIMEIEAAQLPRSLPDVNMAVINGNYALDAGLTVKDALAVEDKDSLAAERYANVLVVKEGNEDDPGIKALIAALQSEEIKAYIESTFNGSAIPMF
ncbi:MAG: MetQ/NlpA family ABC transporter substrate-binding protein [Christensenellales bacterium]|jgi:D-methionine transport system substrate-binding protein